MISLNWPMMPTFVYITISGQIFVASMKKYIYISSTRRPILKKLWGILCSNSPAPNRTPSDTKELTDFYLMRYRLL